MNVLSAITILRRVASQIAISSLSQKVYLSCASKILNFGDA